MTPELEAARLLLRPLALSDAEQAQLLFPQWEIVRYLNSRVPWPYPPDGALTFYRDVALPAVERGEAWHWTLRLKSNPGRMIGNISLMRGESKNLDRPAVARPGPDERGLQCSHRLLVQHSEVSGIARPEGRS